MFLTILALPSSVKRLLPDGTSGMRFQGRSLTRQFLSRRCSPLSNNHGRASYWLNAALVLLVICSAVAVLYFTRGIRNERAQPTVLLDQKESGEPAKRYKVSMPDREAVKLAPGSSSDTAAREGRTTGAFKIPSEATGGQATTPLKKTDNMRLASTAGTADQQDESSPAQIEKQPAMEVEKESSIATREDAGSKLLPGQKSGAQGVVPGPDVTAKTKKGVSHEVDKTSFKESSETGKTLFVRVRAGNVREEPSTTSNVKFRLEMGDPVTMTGKRGGWVAIKLDDGRFGWVYHTLLADSIVPQKAPARANKEIKAIRPEIAAKDVAKVIFELNGPFPPQTMIVEGEKPRVVCDFFDAGLAPDIGYSIEVSNGIVEKIRTGIHKSPKFKVRVVLDLIPDRNYEVDQFFFEKENYYVLVVKAK
jgi:SH3-like domain-containing protein